MDNTVKKIMVPDTDCEKKRSELASLVQKMVALYRSFESDLYQFCADPEINDELDELVQAMAAAVQPADEDDAEGSGS